VAKTMTGEWLSIQQLAKELGVPLRTVYGWRSKGEGPKGATFGRHVRFRRDDVEKWIAAHYDHPRIAG
jgi:excisionase family DNA binding protein